MQSRLMDMGSRRRKPLGSYLGQGALHLFLIAVSLASFMPFVWLFLGSFKTFVEITSGTNFWPRAWTLDNYREIVERVGFAQGLLNSTIVAVSSTLLVMLTSAAAGYVFSKYRFPGKETMFVILLATMMIPGAVTLIPMYLAMVDMHLLDKLAALVVPGVFSTFGIFLMRQFMESIPNELLDAGRIDGASEWWIFAQVVVPLATAPMGALGVLNFLGSWDSYMWPLVVIQSQRNFTLPLVLAGLRGRFWDRYELYCACSMLTIAPVMLLYAIAQKQFIRGIAMTGIKG